MSESTVKFRFTPPGKILKGPTNDRTHIVACSKCGQRVQMDTDRNGRLIGRDPRTLVKHPCPNP